MLAKMKKPIFIRRLYVAILSFLMLTGCALNGQVGAQEPRGSEGAAGNRVASAPPAKPSFWSEAIDFTANLPLTPNVDGKLNGEIAFIQNTLVGPNRAGRERPLLVTDRGAYLLFTPTDPEQKGLQAIIVNRLGERLVLDLLPPENGAHSDFNNTDGRRPMVFSKRAWNAVVPWDFMHAGMSITVQNAARQSGTLPADAFEFGAPLELVAQNIELGMLTDPANVPTNHWSRPGRSIAPELAMDYFQKVPIAKFVAAQYLPIRLQKIVLPNGNIYTQRSTFERAGVYKGDMREAIAKGLISTGINNANVGLLATVGGSQNQPRPYRQTTVHTSAGVYTKKDKKGNPQDHFVVHGLSGGGGQLTLHSTTGNEYSHEYGHDHGLGHYPGGPLSVHSRNGGWGYNLFKHRLVANVAWNGAAGDSDTPYPFGKDAMAGGAPMANTSVFTHHTPYSLKLIQANITAQSGVLDSASPTGYSRWDPASQTMIKLDAATPKPDNVGVPVMTLVGVYDPKPDHAFTTYIYPALYGNWGNVFSPETIRRHDPELAASRCTLDVTDADGNVLSFPLPDKRLRNNLMNQFHVNLNAARSYTRAELRYSNGDARVTLDGRTLKPLERKMPPPIIVGKAHGFTQAALQLRDMQSILVSNGYFEPEALQRAMEDYYGRIHRYMPDVDIAIGTTYSHKGKYYQALSNTPTAAPGLDPSQWREVGDTATFISTKQLPLGELSIDYAQEVMKGRSGVHYFVPVDREKVLASSSYSPAVRQWYAGGSHSTLTVVGATADGNKVAIALRGQINDRHVLNRGAPINEQSRVRFHYHPEDNPDLPRGEYTVEFAAYAIGWHTRRLIEAFKVHGRVAVK